MLSLMSILTWFVLVCRQIDVQSMPKMPSVLQMNDNFWTGAILAGAIFMAIGLVIFGRSGGRPRRERCPRFNGRGLPLSDLRSRAEPESRLHVSLGSLLRVGFLLES